MTMDELTIHDWLQRFQQDHRSVKIGIGDDMALLHWPSPQMLMSSDLLLDGVHFNSSTHTPAQIGRKAITCALSDCAAMAVKPLGVTVSLALPRLMEMDAVKGLYEGMYEIANRFDVCVVGGDTTKWGHPLVIDVAVVAQPYENITPVTRSGAKPGDKLFVTGRLGGSINSRHMSFTPRVKEAYQLAKSFGDKLHSMMDISDGLSLDLWRICQASGVGAKLQEELLQMIIHDDAKKLAVEDHRSPLEHALCDGEDFELLLAVGDDVEDSWIQSVEVTLYPIGEIVESGYTLQLIDGGEETITPKGFVH